MNENTMRNENEELDELDQAEELEELEGLEETEELEDDDGSEEVNDPDDSEGVEDDEPFFLDSDPDAENQEDEETDEDQEETDALQNEDEAEGSEEDGAEAEAGIETEDANQEEVLGSSEAEFYDQVTEAAKQRVQQITGEEYDEFNPKHNVILSAESTKIIGRYTREQDAVNQMESIAKQNGGDAFKKFVQQRLRKLTVEEYENLKAAEASGDYSQTLNKIKEIAEEFKGGKNMDAARQKAAKLNKEAGRFSANHKTVNPPKTISSGTGSAATKKKRSNVLTPEDLGIYK